MKTLRVFISSPGDVRPERVRAYDIIQRLQTKFRAHLKIEAILWEHEAVRGTASYQSQIIPPSQTDVVVCILWARIGLRLPSKEYRRPDGTVPTGTEWEFEDAYAAHQARGEPDLLVYRKTAKPTLTVESDEQLQEWQQQKQALDAFLDRWFKDHEGGFKAAFNIFATDEEFEQQLSSHLEKIINARLQKEADPGSEDKAAITWFEGSPFRGLSVFEPEHRPIFFGRDLAIRSITERLLTQASAGRVFLMVFGMSGCGKSSLVRAGVIPELLRPGIVEGIECWRWAVVRPGESSGALIEGLASALFGKSALPELESLGYDPAKLGTLLRGSPVHAIPLVQAALDQAARAFAKAHERSMAPAARLFLVVDQLEEMFTLDRFDCTQRTEFVGVLTALSQSGLVWILTTMRSDLYSRCAEIDGLLALKGSDGQFDLTPPSFSEIGQMIRAPARAAGLHFQVDPISRLPLDGALHEEAAGNPESLPLLEFALEELYKLRTDKNVITWKAYGTLGGLNGAIAKRAEEVFDSLSPAGRAALPGILSGLIALSENETATARRVKREEMARPRGAEETLAAYTRANLFVTDVDQAGDATLAFAHEALITSWPRVQFWLQENRDFLRIKARVAEAAARWAEAGKDRDFLLPEGKPLAEAEALVSSHRSTLESDLVSFVTLSAQRRHAQQRKKLWRARKLAGVFGVLFLVVLGIMVELARQRIIARRLTAESERLAGINLSKSDEQGVKLFADDQPEKALAFVARSTRRGQPWARERLFSLLTQRSWPSSVIPPLHHSFPVTSCEFDPTGRRILTVSKDKSASIWDALSGKQIVTLRHDDTVLVARFSPDGKWILTGSADKTARIWDPEACANLVKPCTEIRRFQQAAEVTAAEFSSDGLRIVAGCADGTVQVWEASTGNRLASGTHPAVANKDGTKSKVSIRWVRFSPDNRFIATASDDKTARIWKADNGSAATPLLQHEETVRTVEFDPTGTRLVTASEDQSARLWNAKTGQPIGQPMKHNNKVTSACFSPDGTLVLTSSADGTARLWSAENGTATGAPLKHASLVRQARFSPDGRWIVTASYDHTARVWDATSGNPVTEAMTHDGGIECAQFSPDGRYLITGGYDDVARLWDISAGNAIGDVLPQRGVDYAELSANGRDVLVLTKYMVEVWNTTAGKAVSASSKQARLRSAHFDRDGKRFVTSSDDKTARIWDAATGQAIGKPLEHPLEVTNAVFSPDGSRVATVCEDNFARVWDIARTEVVGPPMKHEGFIKTVEFRPDGRVLLTGSYDKSARVWDSSTGAPVGKPMIHPASVDMAHFSPDGTRVVTAANDTFARIWDFQAGQETTGAMKHDQTVTSAFFSPDGTQVVSAAKDGTARVWDAKTGAAVIEPLKHNDLVVSARFAPDGQSIVTASLDGTARTWDVATGVALSEPFRHASGLAHAQFCSDGQRVLTVAEDGFARIWHLAPKDAPPEWLPTLAEVTGGWSLNEFGTLSPVKDKRAMRDQILARFGAGTASPGGWDRVARWFFAQRSQRTLSYNSPTMTADHVAHQAAGNTIMGFQEALRIQPGHPLALARLAGALASGSPPQPQTAEWLSKFSLLRGPAEPEVWRQRAMVLGFNHQLDQALEAVDQALKLDANQPMALDYKANILHDKGRTPEAIGVLQQAITLLRAQQPRNDEQLIVCLMHRARLQIESKKVDGAKEDIAEIRKIDANWKTPQDLRVVDNVPAKAETSHSTTEPQSPRKRRLLYTCFNCGAGNHHDAAWKWFTCWRCGALNYM